MRRATLFTIVFALCGTGLIAQDDLAQYQTHMKAVAAASGALRQAATAKDAAAMTSNATTMVTNFDWIATFFQGKSKDDGVGFAKAAKAASQAVVDAKTPEDMAAAAQKINPTCSACHMVYRAGSAFKGM
jgi:cytochrome c556